MDKSDKAIKHYEIAFTVYARDKEELQRMVEPFMDKENIDEYRISEISTRMKLGEKWEERF